jgi:hypothetical protein
MEDFPPVVCWFAGIYESEGSIQKIGPSLVLSVTQKDRWLCDRLRFLFGGTVGGPYRRNQKGQFYQWRTGTIRSRELAMLIYPLLSPRRQEQMRRVGITPPAPR